MGFTAKAISVVVSTSSKAPAAERSFNRERFWSNVGGGITVATP